MMSSYVRTYIRDSILRNTTKQTMCVRMCVGGAGMMSFLCMECVVHMYSMYVGMLPDTDDLYFSKKFH